nr:D-alanyl-D-alanine carboxypeptidase family protein [Paenibacillus taiwanensis]
MTILPLFISEKGYAKSYRITSLQEQPIKQEKNPVAKPDTNARAAALIDVTTGRILHSENGDKELPMASTTKVMTAIVAIEAGKLQAKVKTSKRAYAKEGSSIYLRLGEEMSLHHMLYGLMLRSGNDAATAIAEHVGGSEEGFVYLMNQKAEELGLEHTQFRNPHGLDEPGHYTTANDLARLSAYALQNATFREIVKTKVKVAPNPNDQWDYKWANKNKMLRLYEGADGVKTGYTKQALRCLVSSATRNGQQLAAVTLNDGSDWVDHEKMLDYGFSSYPIYTLIEKSQKVEGYPLQTVREWRYPLSEQERTNTTFKVDLLEQDSLDYKLGYRGHLKVLLHDVEIGSVPLVETAKSPQPTIQRSGAGQAASFADIDRISQKEAKAVQEQAWLQHFQTVAVELFRLGT